MCRLDICSVVVMIAKCRGIAPFWTLRRGHGSRLLHWCDEDRKATFDPFSLLSSGSFGQVLRGVISRRSLDAGIEFTGAIDVGLSRDDGMRCIDRSALASMHRCF